MSKSNHIADLEADAAAMRDRADDERCDYLSVLLGTSTISRRPYTYCCPFSDVREGDMVVVPFGRENNLLVARVHEVNPPIEFKRMATKWIAAHIDLRTHNMRMALGVPPITEGRK